MVRHHQISAEFPYMRPDLDGVVLKRSWERRHFPKSQLGRKSPSRSLDQSLKR
jgi:hypothetical protein